MSKEISIQDILNWRRDKKPTGHVGNGWYRFTSDGPLMKKKQYDLLIKQLIETVNKQVKDGSRHT